MLADLILHVVDASAPEERRLARRSPRSTRCWRRSAPARRRGCWSSTRSTCSTPTTRARLCMRHPSAVLVSAATGEGLDELRERIEARFEDTLRRCRAAGSLLGGRRACRAARARRRPRARGRAEGVLVSARVPAPSCTASTDFAVNGAWPGAATATVAAWRDALTWQWELRVRLLSATAARLPEPRPRRRRRPRPLRVRGGAYSRRGARERRHRDRGRDPRGPRRPGAAALGPGARTGSRWSTAPG